MEVLLGTSAWIGIASASRPMPSGLAMLQEARPVVTHLTLAELHALRELGRLKGDVDALFGLVNDARREPLLEEDALAASRTYARLRLGGSKVRLVDCLMYAIAQRIKAPFVTFDSDLRGESGVVYVSTRS